ncbi:MAG: LysR family transcriptional regulator [Deltaproteobacteria bacterium]|nr:LysR family transcriptional regulator [Deltaproteobacteria bacterium]
MDKTPQSFEWDHLRVFLATAEAGSYSGASRALGVAQPTIGRQIAALEASLKVALFERVGRGLALTSTGISLLEHARAMSDAAHGVSRVAAGQALALEGRVCITASEIIATHLLPPVLATLRTRYPMIELEVVASNSVQDLRQREADLAIRSFRPTEPELIARKIRDCEAHLYATAGYLRTLAKRVTREALLRATWIGFDPSATYRKGLSKALGLALTEANFAIVSPSQHVQWALARQGLGIAIMLSEVGDADPQMRRVLRDLPAIVVPMWLVTHREVRSSRRVRVVADLLAEGLAGPAPRARRASTR